MPRGPRAQWVLWNFCGILPCVLAPYGIAWSVAGKQDAMVRLMQHLPAQLL